MTCYVMSYCMTCLIPYQGLSSKVVLGIDNTLPLKLSMRANTASI